MLNYLKIELPSISAGIFKEDWMLVNHAWGHLTAASEQKQKRSKEILKSSDQDQR